MQEASGYSIFPKIKECVYCVFDILKNSGILKQRIHWIPLCHQNSGNFGDYKSKARSISVFKILESLGILNFSSLPSLLNCKQCSLLSRALPSVMHLRAFIWARSVFCYIFSLGTVLSNDFLLQYLIGQDNQSPLQTIRGDNRIIFYGFLVVQTSREQPLIS